MSNKKDTDVLNPTPIDIELDEKLKAKTEEIERNEVVKFNVRTRRDERFIAFNLIYSVDRSDYTITLDQAVENFKQGFGLYLPEDSYALTLARGAIDNWHELDDNIKPFLKNWKLERLGCATLLILRMALWELKQPKAIPSIIINEAIELAKAFAEKDAYKFVNGMLDEYSNKHNLKSDVTDVTDVESNES